MGRRVKDHSQSFQFHRKQVQQKVSWADFQLDLLRLRHLLCPINQCVTVLYLKYKLFSPQVYFRRAKVFHSAGSVDDALQLFLHCLALDEGFLPAKLEVEKVLGVQIIIAWYLTVTFTVILYFQCLHFL